MHNVLAYTNADSVLGILMRINVNTSRTAEIDIMICGRAYQIIQ